jgi:hypothetical protein
MLTPANPEGERRDQIAESLFKLWWKVRSCLPPPLGLALLPQSLQGQLPCENGEGLCVHEKVAWLITSRRFVGDEPAVAVDAAKRGLTAATINPRSWLLRATSISPTGNPPARGKETGTLRLRAKS